MTMRFLSLCSGIEAVSVAWAPLGWRAVAYSEIEPFACAVLSHHYPDVPNIGDMTQVLDWRPYAGAVDLVVAGTPCQDFSVAGKRAGLAGERSGLAMVFVQVLSAVRPEWFVWENVPGVFSTNGGRDFGTFLRTLDDIGYSCAWRVLDAQYFGVPQRRRRVYVVGHLGDWRPAAAVLFEPHCLRGDTAPRRKTRADASPCADRGPTVIAFHGSQDPDVSGAIAYPVARNQGRECCITMTPQMRVRRLTPRECERLQGFPDDYTLITYRGKPAADAPRYRALGNSMAVPVMRWIGERINHIEERA